MARGYPILQLVKVAGTLVPQETSVHSLRHTFARSYLSIYLYIPGRLGRVDNAAGSQFAQYPRIYSQPAVSQLAARVERLPLNAYSG